MNLKWKVASNAEHKETVWELTIKNLSREIHVLLFLLYNEEFKGRKYFYYVEGLHKMGFNGSLEKDTAEEARISVEKIIIQELNTEARAINSLLVEIHGMR